MHIAAHLRYSRALFGLEDKIQSVILFCMLLQQRSLKICSWLPLWTQFLPLIKMLYTCLPYGTAHHSLNLPVSLNSVHGTECSSISDLPGALVPARTLGYFRFP